MHGKKSSLRSSKGHLVTFQRFLLWAGQLSDNNWFLQMPPQRSLNFLTLHKKNPGPILSKARRLYGTSTPF